VSGTAPRRRHGLAGLLVALFVVGGLVFSYGLGHAPPARVCTQHAVSAPVGSVSASAGQGHQGPGVSPPHGLHSLADASLTAPPLKAPSPAPLDACLCLAVLFTLILLGLATGLRRPISRLPAGTRRTLPPASGFSALLASTPSLQVLRL
jgi:hypothetical protein